MSVPQTVGELYAQFAEYKKNLSEQLDNAFAAKEKQIAELHKEIEELKKGQQGKESKPDSKGGEQQGKGWGKKDKWGWPE